MCTWKDNWDYFIKELQELPLEQDEIDSVQKAIKNSQKVFNRLELQITDLGCGIGRWNSIFNSNYCNVYGLDKSSNMINYAYLNNRRDLNIYDVIDLTLEIPNFIWSSDIIFSSTFLQHIYPNELQEFFDKLNDKIQSNTHFIIIDCYDYYDKYLNKNNIIKKQLNKHKFTYTY